MRITHHAGVWGDAWTEVCEGGQLAGWREQCEHTELQSRRWSCRRTGIRVRENIPRSQSWKLGQSLLLICYSSSQPHLFSFAGLFSFGGRKYPMLTFLTSPTARHGRVTQSWTMRWKGSCARRFHFFRDKRGDTREESTPLSVWVLRCDHWSCSSHLGAMNSDISSTGRRTLESC